MHSRERTVAQREALAVISPDLENRERHQLLQTQLQELPEDVREALLLKVVEGKSYRQIAAITGDSFGKVGTLVHRGLSHLSMGLRAAGVL